MALEVCYPRPGWAEQDPGAWEKALRPAVAAALEEAGARPRQVAAVGITGQLDGCVPVGPEGRALGPCLIWIDRRADVPLDSGGRVCYGYCFQGSLPVCYGYCFPRARPLTTGR